MSAFDMIEMKFVLYSQVPMKKRMWLFTSPYEEKDVVIDLVNNAEIFPMEKGYKTSSSDEVATSSAELDESELQGFTLACCSVLWHQ